jgi:hypothetical protein
MLNALKLWRMALVKSLPIDCNLEGYLGKSSDHARAYFRNIPDVSWVAKKPRPGCNKIPFAFVQVP